jgi:hypothetical protein
VIRIRETIRTLPFHRPVSLTDLPLLYHRDHLFPYTSYADTERAPVSRAFRMVVLENDALRVEVAPELGGRVYSLFDKRVGREVLFSNPVVKPVRILPIWAFLSGGIEFNFPIAHSPTSIAEVGCRTGQVGDYGFVRVGEREARTGMEWAVELGLAGDAPVLVQRTALRNRTGAAHPWMMWTIAAVRSTEGTEFVHPPHRVLVHDDRLRESDWPGEGLNWDRNLRRMTALFWKPGSAPAFGVFHHDLGCGLMHVADPQRLPGKKVWTYGHGEHRAWGQTTTTDGASYAEIESGPLLDQSEKPLFPDGAEQRFEEFWIPVHSRSACDAIAMPAFELPTWTDPWLGWQHSAWQTEWERFRDGDGPLPDSAVPTGLLLEAALRRAVQGGNTHAAEPLALWLASHGRPAEALPFVETAGLQHPDAPGNPEACRRRREEACSAVGPVVPPRDLGAYSPRRFMETDPSRTAHRIAGLILWKALNEPGRALAHLEAGPLEDPVAVVELDTLYAELELTAKRGPLLSSARDHRLVVERRADLALRAGQAAETLRLLESIDWPREHQRYVRTELWRRAKAALGEADAAAPEFLHEDNLARFGAYWSDS